MKLFLWVLFAAAVLGGLVGGEIAHTSFSITGAVIGGVVTGVVLLGLGAYFDSQQKKSDELPPEIRAVFDRMITGKSAPTKAEVVAAKRNLLNTAQSHETKRTNAITLSPTEAILKLGELIERYPNAVLDVSMLPLPKDKMKLAIKAAWMLEKNTKSREALEVGYSFLGYFQDGIGSAPLKNPTVELPPSKDPKAIKEWLASNGENMKKWTAWQITSLDECTNLAKEFKDWKLK